MAESVADRLAELIARTGPIPVSTYIEEALYGEGGFYMAGGRAGRRGDFLTAPEVGPLFGTVMARAIEGWWRELGEPDTYTVLEWGAGPGTLARAVFAALPDVAPDLLAAGALQWVLIERSAAQRGQHPEHERVRSVEGWSGPPVEAGLVLANELLDNLPFDIHQRGDAGWCDIRVDGPVPGSQRFELVAGPAGPAPSGAFEHADIPVGALLPVQRAAGEWLDDALDSVVDGQVVVLDYGASTAELAARGDGWLRTHVDHGGDADWLEAPGVCDITVDVDLDQLQCTHPAARHSSQAEWLSTHGIEALVDEGRAQWERSAGIGDLAALRARSRVREAEALTDPDGMGAFRVLEWAVGAAAGPGDQK